MLLLKRKRTLLKVFGTVILIIFAQVIYFFATTKNRHFNRTDDNLVRQNIKNNPSLSQQSPHFHSVNVSRLKEIHDETQDQFQNISRLEYGDVPYVIGEKLQKSRTCPNVSRPSNTTYCSTGNFWHLQKNGKQEIMVYSAIYDDRFAVGIIPVLRLSVVSNVPKDALVHCYVWYSGVKYPYVTTANVVSTGRGEKLFGVHYGQLLYSCELPGSLPIPTHVSLSTTLCGNSNILVPVYVPVRTNFQHEFGICVAIAFGEVDFAIISEWIELHRLFGVTEFNIYNASMSASMNKLFNVYEKTGILRVHQMPPPVPDYSKKGSKIGSPASLNDCMLKNMYRYRYAVVNDFDEFIVPRKHQNYSVMLQSIDKENKLKEPWASYTFRNVYYFKDKGADTAQPKYLTTLRYRNRNEPNRYMFAPKSFISPLQCLSVFNHYCWIRFPTTPRKFTIDVSPATAMSQHYRHCGFKKEECENLLRKAFQDDIMLQYKPMIVNRVENVLKSVGYNFIQ